MRDRTGRVAAALNVAMHAARRTTDACRTEILPELSRTATRIEADLAVAGQLVHVPLT
ncbi:hypothetical protein SGLAM104S_01303 [Streptomyces glaucescens]